MSFLNLFWFLFPVFSIAFILGNLLEVGVVLFPEYLKDPLWGLQRYVPVSQHAGYHRRFPSSDLAPLHKGKLAIEKTRTETVER